MSLLSKHKKSLRKPLRQATLCFLVNENEILLAMKKRGLGEGKWNGVGGKMDEIDPSIKAAAVRETFEEIGVKPVDLKKVAVLNFYHTDKSDSGQQVSVFICKDWKGEPTETEEMSPKWFAFSEIPYEHMWEDSRIWLPIILQEKQIKADFLFNKKQELIARDILIMQ